MSSKPEGRDRARSRNDPGARRWMLRLGAGLGTAALLGWSAAQAQVPAGYPSKPIRLVVGFAAGGPTDALARVIAPELGQRLGQQVIVENKPGAAGVIGMDAVTTSPPDGYTLGMLAVTSVVSEAFSGKAFDVQRMSPISLMYDQYNVLITNPNFAGMANVRNLKDLLAYAKANPDKVSYTSAGNGSMGHLTMEWINSLAGVRMTHVAYKGAAPALNDLLGGQLGVMFGDSNSAAPHIKAGKVRPIAVAYADRVADLPDVPTVGEQGFPKVGGIPWVALIAPPGMPPALVEKINADLRAVYAKPDVAEKIRSFRVNPKTTTPEATKTLISREFLDWKKVITDNNIKAD